MQALTPPERWQAIRRLGSGSAGEQAFVILCGTALLVLVVLLVAVSYKHRQDDRRIANELFSAYADRRGLSRRERHILLNIATKARLKRNESIFTLAGAFDRGAAEATDQALASAGARKGRRLGAELAVLREKLGFELRIVGSPGSTTKPSRPGSRQIPLGKTLQIVPRDNHQVDNIEGTVIKNDQIELAVKLAGPLDADPGDLCCVHYFFGASVWEFDASVISCHGGILLLTHSFDIRFINRRRFLRVPVNKPAFIASFPFARTFPSNDSGTDVAGLGSTASAPAPWGPPEFVPAEVTELAGPGLRLEAPLEVEVGDRVVVILRMSEGPAASGQASSPQSVFVQRNGRTPPKVVEDVGHVRHVQPIEDGFSIAIELTGLTDSNVNELVRETNSASFEFDARNQEVRVSAKSDASGIAEPVEQVAVQGI